MPATISEDEIEAFRIKTRAWSNSGRFKEVYALAKRHAAKHPDVLLFAYTEAVFTAEDTTGLSRREADRRYALAAQKLKKLFPRLRSASPDLRRSIRNEYYWFSKQPRKQYKLGVEYGKTGYYSAGVGAAQIAKQYAEQGRRGLCRRWAKISEKAWLRFFSEINDKWFNSYMFYAMALAYQGRHEESEAAIRRAAKIAGQKPNWKPLEDLRGEIAATLAKLESTRPRASH